jgi:23S rRNA pseudouridine1911/1915/1917 synthase
VHLQSIGYPIVGDPVYHLGAPRQAKPPIDRQALHAQSLGLMKPATGEPLHFEQSPPADFIALLNAAGLPVE